MSPYRKHRHDGQTERRRKTDYWVIGAVALAVLCTLICVVVVAPTTLGNRSDIIDQKEGRQIALAISCNINKAVIQSGEQALRGGVLLPGDQVRAGEYVPGPLSRELQRTVPSYPSFEERVVAANRAAAAYRDKIVSAVVQASRDQGVEEVPVNPDGTLNCEKYAEVTAGR